MENVDVPIFEDPALKAALRRHYRCDECCPAHVRDNIAMLFGEMKSPPTPRTGMRWWRSHGPSLAIAASMLVAIGVVTLTLTHSAHAVPTRLQTAACFRHDSCSSLHIKHTTPGVPQSFADVGQFLRTKLNHPVLAANFTKEQWHFRGAAICPVDGIQAAHLLFDKDNGNQTLSVFSLPADSFPSLKNKQTYEGSYEGHTVVARREDGAVYCLVCKDPSGSIDAGTLRDMLQQHESEASVAAAPIKPSRNLHLALSIPTEN